MAVIIIRILRHANLLRVLNRKSSYNSDRIRFPKEILRDVLKLGMKLDK